MGMAPSKLSSPSSAGAAAAAGMLSTSNTNKMKPPVRRPFHPTRRRSTPHILQQLILLRDWQRVLIRVRLYPQELSKPVRITIDASTSTPGGGAENSGTGAVDQQQQQLLQVKVLPLHLACALDPPPAVVKLLLELYPDACTVPVLPASTTTTASSKLGSLPRRLLLSSQKQKQQQSPRINDNNKSKKHRHQQQRRSHWKSSTTKQNRFFGKLLWYRGLRADKKQKLMNNDASFFPQEITMTNEDELCLLGNNNKPDEVSVYYSAEQDGDNGGDLRINFTNDDNDDDDDDDDCEGSSLSSRSWNDRDNGVILQLSPSGNVTPLPLDRSNETDSTSIASSASASIYRVRWDMTPLIEARGGGLLALHLACLYRASTEILQLLLQAFPIAALSDVLGMLPIHWVAAGWHAPQPLLKAPPSQLPDELEAAAAELMPGGNKAEPLEVLRLLKQTIPETVRVQSGNHSMTPDQYIEECMEDGDYKEQCLQALLEDVVEDDSLSLSTTTSCSLLFVDSVSDAEGTSCLYNTDGTNKNLPSANMSALIAKQDWNSVLTLTEDDPLSASKWLYGIDEDKTLVAPLIWKRLPIHLACSKNAPVGILHVLVQSYPEGAATPDPYSGSLPLHLVCQKGGDSSCLPAVRFLLQTCPTATKAIDMRGRLPLHLAVLSMAPYPVIELLVEHDPQSATIPDANGGKTPLEYALQTYGRQHMVSELLSMVFEFDKHQLSKSILAA